MSRHLALIQQFAGTSGHCHLWAYALRELFPEGRMVALMAKDSRTFEKHDWPEEEPLELHRFLMLPDGTAVDAQGAHEMDGMLAKFGIRRGYRYETVDLVGEEHSMEALERDHPDWVGDVRLRHEVLVSYGWGNEIPHYDGELERNWKSVMKAVEKGGVPEPEPLSSSAVKL